VKKWTSFPVDDHNTFKTKMLNWANRFNIFCFLDNAHYNTGNPAFECLLAAGSEKSIEANAGNAFDQLQNFYTQHPNDWLFGHFGYDLKNETGHLTSGNDDGIGFPDLHFFIPLLILELDYDQVRIYGEEAEVVFREISNMPAWVGSTVSNRVTIHNKIPRNEYIQIIDQLKQHILRGDCYEINFCQEFFATGALIDPVYIYSRLSTLSPNPFSVLYKLDARYCLCASPERYLKRTGNRIISQPIKGTAKRHLQNPAADEKSKNSLLHSEKEKSENVMIVDLVRNDLSRICKAGTVKVDELFGIYSFPQVHQMISTVSGELEKGTNWVDCVRSTFPMGSMTGAPKQKVMELIEKYERTKRGLFSGAIGYVTPGGDFDLNVVIRSMLYNEPAKYLSFQTGGAITYNSDAEMEYQECLLKAEAMMKILQ
jgi:para-aminobenzoate synthetase component I